MIPYAQIIKININNVDYPLDKSIAIVYSINISIIIYRYIRSFYESICYAKNGRNGLD